MSHLTAAPRMTPFTLATSIGPFEFHPREVYSTAKVAFLADYADDPAVEIKICRNGDLAEREYAETIKALSPELCTSAHPDAINATLATVARMALCNLAIGYKRRKHA